jgi:hypothetical protein
MLGLTDKCYECPRGNESNKPHGAGTLDGGTYSPRCLRTLCILLYKRGRRTHVR